MPKLVKNPADRANVTLLLRQRLWALKTTVEIKHLDADGHTTSLFPNYPLYAAATFCEYCNENTVTSESSSRSELIISFGKADAIKGVFNWLGSYCEFGEVDFWLSEGVLGNNRLGKLEELKTMAEVLGVGVMGPFIDKKVEARMRAVPSHNQPRAYVRETNITPKSTEIDYKAAGDASGGIQITNVKWTPARRKELNAKAGVLALARPINFRFSKGRAVARSMRGVPEVRYVDNEEVAYESASQEPSKTQGGEETGEMNGVGSQFEQEWCGS